MKKMIAIAIGLSLTSLTGCASVKDETGKTVGTCFGGGCVLRAALGANTIDSKTGLMKGNIPLFKVGGSAPASAPATESTMDKATDIHAAATTTSAEPAAPAAQ